MGKFFDKILYGGGVIFDLAKWVILAAIILVIINQFFISIFIVDGVSMESYLHDKEIVLLNKMVYSGDKTPERLDVVVVKYPGDPLHKKYVKRVIALPGETLQIINSEVFVNGQKIKELFLDPDTLTEPDGIWTMNEKEYFLMGDNRPNSNDCRAFGPVERRFFSGKAVLVIFPKLRNIEY